MNITVAVSEVNGEITIHLREEPSAAERMRFGKMNISVHPFYHPLVQLMRSCDQIVAYNAEFDVRCMMKYCRGADPTTAPKVIMDSLVAKIYDPMLSIATHEGAKYRKLDSALALVLGDNFAKTADGCSAVHFFWSGKIVELSMYCAEDVKLVRQLDSALLRGFTPGNALGPPIRRLSYSENMREKRQKFKTAAK